MILDKTINEAIIRCRFYCDIIYENEKFRYEIQQLIDRYNENLFINIASYYLLLFSYEYENDLMSKFIEIEEYENYIDEDLTYEKFVVEIRKKYQNSIFHIVNNVRNIRNDFENELINWTIPEIYLEDYDLEKGAIPSNYINLVSFLLIRRGLIERYTAIWIMEYDYDKSFSYIEPCQETYVDIYQQYHRFLVKHFGNENKRHVKIHNGLFCGAYGFYDPSKYLDEYIKVILSKNGLFYKDKKGLTALAYFLLDNSVKSEIVDFRFIFYNMVERIAILDKNSLFEISKQLLFESIEDTIIRLNKEQDIEIKNTLESLINQLNSLIGLDKVKKDVSSLINLLKVRKIREERGLKQIPISLHLVFTGNPGTGKTTVARLLAKIYHELGIVSKGHLIEVDRSKLVAGYVGQTAIKVQEMIQEAVGGILFIDEAYSLTVNRGENDFGFEAVDTLLKGMGDHRDNLIVIVAGYPNLMTQFLNSNPGLRSRFNKIIFFQDYTPQELVEIFKSFCNSAEYIASEECIDYVGKYYTKRYEEKNENFANARDVRNYFEKALLNQANRLSNLSILSDDELMMIQVEDVQNIIL